MVDALVKIALFMLLQAGVFGLLYLVCRHLKVFPEISRKLAHVCMGLACLSFPWLFKESWPVLLLCVFSLILMSWLKRQKGVMGQILHGVERKSYGEICFPVAVATLFVLRENPLETYIIPVLLLALADAMSTLIGIRYGQSRFSTEEGYKSFEGSLAFFVTAFLSTHVPLLLLTRVGRAESLMIGLLVGLIIMLVEAISWRGLDNLFIPLGARLLLLVYLDMGVKSLLVNLLVIIVLVTFFMIWKKRTYAKDTTVLAAALMLYMIWVAAGWQWALVPLAVAIGYGLLCPKRGGHVLETHGLFNLGSVAGAGLFWLFVAFSFDMSSLYIAYSASWCAQLTMIACAYCTNNHPGLKKMRAAMITVLFTISFLSLPMWYAPLGETFLVYLSWMTITSFVSTFVFWGVERRFFGETTHEKRSHRQLFYGFVVSCITLLALI